MTSEIHFPVNIKPRLLSAYLNSAACMFILQRSSVSQRVLSSCSNVYIVTICVCAELPFTPICRNEAVKFWFRTGSLPSLYVSKSIEHD